MLLLPLVLRVSVVRLHPKWCALIKGVQGFEKEPSPPRMLSHTECKQEGLEEPLLHLLPPIIILWTPLEQFKDFFQDGLQCPKCDTANSTLYGYRWKDGVESERSEPRKINGRDGKIALVGRVYKKDMRLPVITQVFCIKLIPNH